ncbi:MAG: Asp-tRNA(Asn)/Glu-tRNA(Gln) amidotransferase subunit GatC [Candidatus Hydrothermia bacterium]|jgi:aspartyl-tRNA(Asn)/glutamyl-tRNA(Gln) amidotransferase subunit C|nr:Asp-tRNA(Asn)/Glu-tRNA(Gln) amidotransferase subunit GatC [Candidatus Hydrothermia bacterium]
MNLEKFEELAKIKIQNEREKFNKHFENMINYFSQLKELNTDNIEPLFNPIEIECPLREDLIGKSIDRLTALNLSPDYYLEFFKSPSPIKK